MLPIAELKFIYVEVLTFVCVFSAVINAFGVNDDEVAHDKLPPEVDYKKEVTEGLAKPAKFVNLVANG